MVSEIQTIHVMVCVIAGAGPTTPVTLFKTFTIFVEETYLTTAYLHTYIHTYYQLLVRV